MSECVGLVYDIRKGSCQDGPGLRTTVLLKGCSLSCWWCHDPELQSPGPELVLREVRCVRCGSCVKVCNMEAAREEALPDDGTHYTIEREECIVCGACISGCAGQARTIAGKRWCVSDVMEQVLPDLPVFTETGGGVTFSGGEPLMQSAFLGELLEACKSEGIHTTVDTSGYTPWEVFDQVRANVDLFLYDLKIMDDNRHRKFTGLPNGLILENLQKLSALGHCIIVRIPLIAGITDDAENLHAIGAFAAKLPQIEGVELIPYQQTAREKYERLGKPYHLEDARAPTPEKLDEIIRLLGEHGLNAGVVCKD